MCYRRFLPPFTLRLFHTSTLVIASQQAFQETFYHKHNEVDAKQFTMSENSAHNTALGSPSQFEQDIDAIRSRIQAIGVHTDEQHAFISEIKYNTFTTYMSSEAASDAIIDPFSLKTLCDFSCLRL